MELIYHQNHGLDCNYGQKPVMHNQKGKLNVIQTCQFRKDHRDSHYASAIFRYQIEYAFCFLYGLLTQCHYIIIITYFPNKM